MERLRTAGADLDDHGARELALGFFRAELDAILSGYVADHRQRALAAFECWWDKYSTTLESIQHERDQAESRLRRFLEELGYD